MRASFSPQSELAPRLLRFAQSYLVASRCRGDCIMCAAQGIKGHADLASSSPSSQHGIHKYTVWRKQSCDHLLHTAHLCALCWAVSRDTYNTRRGLRSLPHLREQFKPRADDGHASPVCPSCEVQSFLRISCRFLALVRFFAYRRIKPHDPPLVRVPVYSFEF
ncbi:MAG: hypothetical protein RL641_948 [Candidatus Parcubacteria bacterium]